MVLYRAYGGGSARVGGWLTPRFPLNRVAVRNGLSLPPQNAAEEWVQVKLPRGTVVRVGRAGPDFGEPGGWEQVEVISPVEADWFYGGGILAPGGAGCGRVRCP